MSTTDMQQMPPVSQYLNQHQIPHRVFRHDGPVVSLEQAARERQQQPDQVVRSLLFRMTNETYIMVLMTGTKQVSWPALRGHLGRSRLSLASEEQVQAVTGYQIGAVSPFGLPQPIRILIEHSIFAHAEISIGSGWRGTTIIMRSEELRRALPQAEIGPFARA